MWFVLVVTYMLSGAVHSEQARFTSMEDCNATGVHRLAQLARDPNIRGGIAKCTKVFGS